jgi:hypothetical protein
VSLYLPELSTKSNFVYSGHQVVAANPHEWLTNAKHRVGIAVLMAVREYMRDNVFRSPCLDLDVKVGGPPRMAPGGAQQFSRRAVNGG